jgi:hypothetical protein
VKNSIKFISIGLVMVMLLMTQWTVDKSVEAAAVAEDKVEWMDSSADVVTYYSPGTGTSTASFWIKDTGLETIPTASTTWNAVGSTIAANTTWSIHAGTLSAGTAGVVATSTGSTYSTTNKASTTISSLTATDDGASMFVSTAADGGTFDNLFSVANGSKVVATYSYHVIDAYNGSTAGEKIAKVTSTSDTAGEWISISEVTASGNSTPDDQADFYTGSVILSDDAGATASGDSSVWVQDGDTLTVSYYGCGDSCTDAVNSATVVDSTTATIDYSDPSITVTSPADGTKTKDTTPSMSFTVADTASGFTSTTPLSHVSVTVNGCALTAAEHAFTGLTSTEMGFTVALGSLTAKWTDASTPNSDCSAATRTGGGFNVVGTTVSTSTSGTWHGTKFSYSITATDKAGNSKKVDGTDAEVTIDTTAPDLISAVAGKGWDADKTGTESLTSGDVSVANSVKLVFDESVDQASVSTSDFTVGGVTPASVSFGGKKEFIDRLVYLNMATDLAPSAKPDVKLVGSVTDVTGNELVDRPSGSTAGTDRSGSTTDSYGDKVTATDGVKPTVSEVAVDSNLLASKGKAILTFGSDENMKDNGETVANGCTCVTVTGGGASGGGVTSAKLAVTLTSPTAGKATLKQSDYSTTGIYGLVVQAKDVNNNEGNSGGVKVTNEDVSAEIAASLASTSTTATIGLKKWPLADHDADGTVTDSITATVNGTAVDITVSAVDWSETEEVTVAFTGAASTVLLTDTVKFTYYYVDASQVVEVDVSKPAASAFTPADGASTENRTPFISVTWDEDEYAGDTNTTVTLTAATLTDPDGTATDILANMSTTDNKDFFYRPSADLAFGEYTFKVSAEDAAGNEKKDESAKFTIKERSKTSISLLPGWNLVSLPGTPSDTAINSVITNAQVDTVLTYDPTVPGGWLTAVRDSGGDLVGTLAAIDASRGYWIHTTNDDPIKVDIPGYAGGSQQLPPAIALVKGWNLVPAVSITGGAVASTLDSDTYFTGLDWTRAYGFSTASDAFSSFIPTTGADTSIVIGRGYWVFLSKAGTLVP